MADHNENDALTDPTPEKERMADQQFGAKAARDQEAADRGDDTTGDDREQPRAGNKEDDLA